MFSFILDFAASIYTVIYCRLHRIFCGLNPEINFVPFRDISSSNILGMILNMVMFVPFGAFLPIYFQKFRSLKLTVAAGFFTSLTIEVLQLFCFRATDVDDLLMNTLGTLIGFFVGKCIVGLSMKKDEVNKDVINLFVMVLISILVVIFANEQLMSIAIDLFGF